MSVLLWKHIYGPIVYAAWSNTITDHWSLWHQIHTHMKAAHSHDSQKHPARVLTKSCYWQRLRHQYAWKKLVSTMCHLSFYLFWLATLEVGAPAISLFLAASHCLPPYYLSQRTGECVCSLSTMNCINGDNNAHFETVCPQRHSWCCTRLFKFKPWPIAA